MTEFVEAFNLNYSINFELYRFALCKISLIIKRSMVGSSPSAPWTSHNCIVVTLEKIS